MDLSPHEAKYNSQNGEDGITMKLVEIIYTSWEDKFYVEFGVNDGRECNSNILRDFCKWKGLQMDGGFENPSVNHHKEFITRENIIGLFHKYNVPNKINYLSVDLDFNDFYILNEIVKNYSCDIIVCEYNASHKPHEDKIVIYNPNYMWDETNYFGVSLLALTRLMNKYNYSLIYCDNRGVNAFFVNNDLGLQFKDQNDVSKIYKPPRYGLNILGGHTHDPLNRSFVSSDTVMS